MNKYIFILLFIIPLNFCNRGKAESKIIVLHEEIETKPQDIQTETKEIVPQKLINYYSTELKSYTEDLDITEVIGVDLTENPDTKMQLVNFINNTLKYNGKSFYKAYPMEHHGVKYSLNINGKYLFVTETEFGGGGSSYEVSSIYIFDTELIKQIPPESIFINSNAPNPSFHKLVIEYLLKDDGFNWIEKEYLPKAEDSITDYGFSLFYVKDGIGLRWDEGTLAANAAGAFETVLPYSYFTFIINPSPSRPAKCFICAEIRPCNRKQ